MPGAAADTTLCGGPISYGDGDGFRTLSTDLPAPPDQVRLRVGWIYNGPAGAWNAQSSSGQPILMDARLHWYGVDLHAPTVGYTSPVNGQSEVDPGAGVHAGVSDVGGSGLSSSELYLDGGALVASSPSGQLDWNGTMSPGMHTATVRARDGSGNEAAVYTWTFSVRAGGDINGPGRGPDATPVPGGGEGPGAGPVATPGPALGPQTESDPFRNCVPLKDILCLGVLSQAANFSVAGAPVPTYATVLAYAPEVYVHPDERYFPYDPRAFVAHSALWWSHWGRHCPHHKAKRTGTIDPAKLGYFAVAPYYHRPRGLFRCQHDARGEFSSGEYTRPFDAGRPPPLRGWDIPFVPSTVPFVDEGFYLDLDNEHHGHIYEGYARYRTSAPLSFQVYRTPDGSFAITYWQFYAYNSFRMTGGLHQTHEGDWERISVHLDSALHPSAVAYYRHEGEPQILGWGRTFFRDGTHPKIFAGLGSHASYAAPGSYGLQCIHGHGLNHDLASGGGRPWRTWERGIAGLLNVTAFGWYAFGGGWGEVGNVEFTTGPLGPGWKEALPAEWLGGPRRSPHRCSS
jgi:hypothetical protein